MPSQFSPKAIVETLLSADASRFDSYDEFEAALQRKLGCDLDYVRRLLNGTRPLREAHQAAIKSLLNVPTLDFETSPRDMALRLGLSRQQVDGLLGLSGRGLDFAARANDRRAAQQLFDIVGGYWELVFWSFSRRDEQAISRELCVIDGVDDANFLKCRITDVNFTYSGVVFPVLNHLYFMVEKDKLFDEVVIYLTNRPDRSPPILRGISLGLSGGVDEIHSYPTASKAAFRHLGRNADEVRAHYPDAPQTDDLEQFLASRIARYLNHEDLQGLSSEELARLQVARIDNRIPPDAVPFVLQSSG